MENELAYTTLDYTQLNGTIPVISLNNDFAVRLHTVGRKAEESEIPEGALPAVMVDSVFPADVQRILVVGRYLDPHTKIQMLKVPLVKDCSGAWVTTIPVYLRFVNSDAPTPVRG